MPIEFYDSASPKNIPSGSYAAVYVNGYKWSEADIQRMHKVFRISVHGDPSWARYARCIDIERDAATPADAVPFIKLRRELGFNDATVYVNRSNYSTVHMLIARAGLQQPYYWVATLDGTQQIPGAWAVQYQGSATGSWDRSILWGVDNFVRP